MQSHPLNTLFLIAACALSTGATAQNTYKCGNSYSQTPCAGGMVIDTADPRSPAQKLQTDVASARDAKVADAMEKARLKKEKADLMANLPLAPLASPEVAYAESAPSTTSSLHAKKKEPAPFTAQVPGEKKKKSALKKKAKKKKVSQA